jgi:hypothetical protein
MIFRAERKTALIMKAARSSFGRAREDRTLENLLIIFGE